jgi:hypothetical protein
MLGRLLWGEWEGGGRRGEGGMEEMGRCEEEERGK